MKRTTVFVLILIASVTSTAKAQEPVFFNDPYLEYAVESALGVLDPTPIDMLDLVSLTAYGYEILDLGGLEYAINLIYLDLGINWIMDISPISQLSQLKWLYMDNNIITDISPIAGLTNLIELDLGINQISDISAISTFEHLEALYLDVNTLNTSAYCAYLPLIGVNNPQITELDYDPNPNPLTNDCSTDIVELAIWTPHWLDTACEESNNWCANADLDHNGNVNLSDFAYLAKLWLQGL